MGDLNEFSFPTRLFLKAYKWRRIDPVPYAPLKKPLSQCKLAIGSSAGFVLSEQPKFNALILGGDTSFRQIPADTDVKRLIDSHRSESFDHEGIETDPTWHSQL